MTYSLIARDPATGALGVAAQSHWFNVGQPVAWVRFGVGAVATQAAADPSYGWRGLALMGEGVEPARALQNLSDADRGREQRQVAMINASGAVAVRTGSECIDFAGHLTGDGWSAQGNLLATPTVVEAMAAAYESARGPLVERMLIALEAAEAAGGDLRGRQSAVIRIVPSATAAGTTSGDGIDLRVCDHDDPLGEMRRLTTIGAAYHQMERGLVAIDEGRSADALTQLDAAVRHGHADELEFWRAVGLVRLERVDEAVVAFGRLVDVNPMYTELLARVAKVDSIGARLQNVWNQRR